MARLGRRQPFKPLISKKPPAAAAAATVKFRKTLSRIGTGVGKRQTQGA